MATTIKIPFMTKREIQNLLKIKFQQLQIINENRKEFEERDGRRGFEDRINQILDDINYLNSLLD